MFAMNWLQQLSVTSRSQYHMKYFIYVPLNFHQVTSLPHLRNEKTEAWGVELGVGWVTDQRWHPGLSWISAHYFREPPADEGEGNYPPHYWVWISHVHLHNRPMKLKLLFRFQKWTTNRFKCSLFTNSYHHSGAESAAAPNPVWTKSQ